MSTSYIVNRHSPKVTRDQLNKDFETFVSKDDAANGLTVNTATSIGLVVDGDCAWFSFDEANVLVCAEIFSQLVNGDGGIDAVANKYGLEWIDEHNADFGYHEFPVDVRVEPAPTPDFSKDGWEAFIVDGWVVPWHRPSGLFFYGNSRPHDQSFDFDVMIEEIKDEWEM